MAPRPFWMLLVELTILSSRQVWVRETVIRICKQMSLVPILHGMSFPVLVHHLGLYPKSKLQAHSIEILSAFELGELEPKETHRNSVLLLFFNTESSAGNIQQLPIACLCQTLQTSAVGNIPGKMPRRCHVRAKGLKGTWWALQSRILIRYTTKYYKILIYIYIWCIIGIIRLDPAHDAPRGSFRGSGTQSPWRSSSWESTRRKTEGIPKG